MLLAGRGIESHLVTAQVISKMSSVTLWILAKLYVNDPGTAFLRTSLNNLIPVKTLVAIATNMKNIENLYKSFCLKLQSLGTANFACSFI